MCIFDLAPHARLPLDFEATSFCGLLDAKSRLGAALQISEFLTPLDQQPRANQETLARQNRSFQSSQFVRGQTGYPALNDTPGHVALLSGHNRTLVEDRFDLDTGPDGCVEVADDGFGGADLDVTQRLDPVLMLLHQGGVVRVVFWRPTQQGVGVEIAHHHLDNLLPVGTVPAVAGLGLGLGNVLCTRCDRGHGDEMVF